VGGTALNEGDLGEVRIDHVLSNVEGAVGSADNDAFLACEGICVLPIDRVEDCALELVAVGIFGVLGHVETAAYGHDEVFGLELLELSLSTDEHVPTLGLFFPASALP